MGSCLQRRLARGVPAQRDVRILPNNSASNEGWEKLSEDTQHAALFIAGNMACKQLPQETQDGRKKLMHKRMEQVFHPSNSPYKTGLQIQKMSRDTSPMGRC